MSKWKLFAKPEVPFSDQEIIDKIGLSTSSYDYLFATKGTSYVVKKEVLKKPVVENQDAGHSIVITLDRPVVKCNWVRLADGYFTPVTGCSGNTIAVNSLMQNLPVGQEVVLAEFSRSDVDDADIFIQEIWDNLLYDVICITKRFRHAVPSKTEDIMAACLARFMVAISSIQRKSCSSINLRAYILTYIRAAPKALLHVDWLVRPIEHTLPNGKRRLIGDVNYSSLSAKISEGEDGSVTTFADQLEESRTVKPLSEDLIYNLRQVVKDEKDWMIVDYVAQGYTLREIAEFMQMSHVAIQKRLKGLKCYESQVR